MRPIHLFVVFILIFAAGCSTEEATIPETQENYSPIKQVDKHEAYVTQTQEEEPTAQPAIAQNKTETREYLIGVIPSPKTQPNTSFDDMLDAYGEAGELGEVMMVWTNPNCIGQTQKLKENRVVEAVRNNQMEPILTLSFATITEVPGEGLVYSICAENGTTSNITDQGFREAYVAEARALSSEFKPQYLSLGNEINDYFYLHPEDLDSYISLYDEAYAAIKEESPSTQVFVIFSYTHLIDNNQWDLIETFNSRTDLIGLTTYPWKHYETPDQIPAEYYSQIENHTTKPIGFTEIGWPSTNSEAEQAEFLDVFFERTEGMDVEFVNWLFLHEIQLEGAVGSITSEETQTIALRNADGSQKEIYSKWEEISQKEVEN